MANEAKFEYKIQLDLIDLASSKAGRLSQQLDAIDKTALRANQAMARVGNQLSVASTAGVAGFRNTAQQVESLRVSLLNVEAAAGNAGNNVAQVGSAAPKFNMLNMSVQQVARELPALAISANTFFLAISNNLPILADAISNARKENAALIAQNKTAIPVWRQVVSSLFSWQTGLVLAVTALSLYGSEIAKFVGDLFNFNKGLEDNRKNLDAVRAVNKAYNTELNQSVANLRYEYEALLNSAQGSETRRKAIEQMNKVYGEYMPYLLSEKSTIEEINSVYEAVNVSLRAQIALKSKQAQIEKILEESSKKQAEAIQNLQDALSEQNINTSLSDDIISSLVKDTPKWREAGDNISEAFVQATKNIKSEFSNIAFNKDVRRGIYDYIKSFYEMEGSVEAVSKRVDLLIGKTNEITNIGEVVITPDETEKSLNRNLSTIGGITNKINELKEAQNKASFEQAANIEREIQLWQQKLNLIRREIAERNAGNLAQTGSSLSVPSISPLPVPIKPVLPESFEAQDMADIQRRWKDSLKILVEDAEISGRQISGLLTGSISNFASGFGEALASGDGLEIFRSLLISVMDMLQQFGSALIAAGTASLAFQSLFVNPIAGIIAGSALIATAAAAKAALQQATAMANGGIVSGPTLALVGEYSGASNNPEVVAPLNKLKSMIEPAYQPETTGEVRFVIRGEVLEGILHKMNHKRSRTR